MIEVLQADVQMTLHAEISLSRNKLPLLAVSESKAFTIAWDFCLCGLVRLPDFFFFFNKALCSSFFFAVWVAGSKKKKRGIKEMDGMPCSRACQEVRKS